MARIRPQLTMEHAQAQGYTRRICLENTDYCLDLMVKPGTDIEGSFVAFCNDECEWLDVSGWEFELTEGSV